MESSKQEESGNPTLIHINLSLRLIEASDLDDYMIWASDDKVTKFCSWESYTNKADLLKYITDVVIPHPWFRAICIDNRAVGAISLTPDKEPHKSEMGYVLAAEHWGKGIVTRAVKLAVETAFREVEGLQRVEALVDVDNGASQRVLEKAGFEREGVLRKYAVMKGRSRDMVMFSFLDSDLLVDGVGIMGLNDGVFVDCSLFPIFFF